MARIVARFISRFAALVLPDGDSGTFDKIVCPM
jgi:hypothetical protein